VLKTFPHTLSLTHTHARTHAHVPVSDEANGSLSLPVAVQVRTPCGFGSTGRGGSAARRRSTRLGSSTSWYLPEGIPEPSFTSSAAASAVADDSGSILVGIFLFVVAVFGFGFAVVGVIIRLLCTYERLESGSV